MVADLVPIAEGIGMLSAALIIGIGLKKFGKGYDKKWSLANTQLIWWTGIIVGSYFALAIANNFNPITIPDNSNSIVFIGIAVGTMPAASIIRSVQSNPPSTPPQSTAMKQILGSEKNPDNFSIAKMQMSAWNIIAMILFLAQVSHILAGSSTSQFPDLGNTLTYILGISNGIYLANKTADTPKTT